MLPSSWVSGPVEDSTSNEHQFSCVGNMKYFSVDKKNQLDVTFCILYFSSNSCSTHFGQPRAHHQKLTTVWCYSLVLVCAVTKCGVTQICLTVSGLCVDMRVFMVLVSLLYVGLVHSETCLCNTTHCYSTYQHEAITSHSRQLLMMGTWLPETCWATIIILLLLWNSTL